MKKAENLGVECCVVVLQFLPRVLRSMHSHHSSHYRRLAARYLADVGEASVSHTIAMLVVHTKQSSADVRAPVSL